jgi:hypothetical protein
MASNFLNAGPTWDATLVGVNKLLKLLGVPNPDETVIGDLHEVLAWPGVTPGLAKKVEICVTSFSPLHGGPIVAGTISLTNDHVAHTPVKWSDDVGSVPAPADAMVVSSDTTVATVAFNADMTDVDTTPVADGTCTITVSSASLSLTDMATVNVIDPTASSVDVDAADTTFTPKP